jgi:hypothetical protein
MTPCPTPSGAGEHFQPADWLRDSNMFSVHSKLTVKPDRRLADHNNTRKVGTEHRLRSTHAAGKILASMLLGAGARWGIDVNINGDGDTRLRFFVEGGGSFETFRSGRDWVNMTFYQHGGCRSHTLVVENRGDVYNTFKVAIFNQER